MKFNLCYSFFVHIFKYWVIFKAIALWAYAFYKSKCPSVCVSLEERAVYQPKQSEVDFRKRRVTDRNTCRSVTVPKVGLAAKEVIFTIIVEKSMACVNK